MYRVVAKFVSQLMSGNQKDNRATICRESLDCAKDAEIFVNQIITSDETWVYEYNVKTKV